MNAAEAALAIALLPLIPYLIAHARSTKEKP